jgi:hypothetical protein
MQALGLTESNFCHENKVTLHTSCDGAGVAAYAATLGAALNHT